MGERYLVTGVQLGMLITATQDIRQSIVKDITDTQFICDTDNTDIEDDVEIITKLSEFALLL